MEFRNDDRYASHAQGTAGVTLGSIGTALGALNTLAGGASALFGRPGNAGMNGGGQPGANFVTQKELEMMQSLSAKDATIAMLSAEKDTDAKLVEVYKVMDSRFREIEKQLAAQAVVNAQITANIAVAQNQIAQINAVLGTITKTVIPIDSICPEVMQRYNSWTAPTAAATGTAAASGAAAAAAKVA